MKIADLNGKNVCVLGFGREGQAAVRALERYAPSCEITIADRDESVPRPTGKHWLQLGTGWLENLGKFDVIIKSPGIPPQPSLGPVASKIISSTQIFLDTVAESGATVIGVTGSKGKSTTASLIHAILEAAGKKAFLAGNIGNPALDVVDQASPETIFVLEMSSYQLMDLTRSPHIAVMTSFFPEHLDYHGSLDNYLGAKKNIARFQTERDAVFYNQESPATKQVADASPGKKIPFNPDNAPLPIEETLLRGRHNLGNIAAAFQVAQYLGIPSGPCLRVFRTFKGLPHRLQSLGVREGIEWVDDSISTTPQSAVAALDALGDRVQTVILGGQDRGYDFMPLAQRLKGSSVKNVILLPDSGQTIRQAIEKEDASVGCLEAKTMAEAVALAARETRNRQPVPSTPIVLLSPASPSYGHFKNFEERGDAFRTAIERL